MNYNTDKFENYNMEEKENLKIILNSFSVDTLRMALDFAQQIENQKNQIKESKKNELVKEEKIEPEVKFVDSGNVPTPQKQNIIQKTISAAKAFKSKGFAGNKAPDLTKALRILSCHGDDTFTPCPYREKSVNYPNSFFCGACGCGDKSFTQLVSRVDENGETTYAKLDFPEIQCPLKMPGFINYGETELDSEENKNSRKIYLENTRGIGYIKEHSYIKVEKNDENSRTESEQPNDQSNPNTENQQSND